MFNHGVHLIEETEKLKTEIKDLKEITKLKEQMKEQNLDDDVIVDNEVNLENMKENKTRTVPQSQFPTGKNSKKEKEFNCPECFFQGTKLIELNKHMSLKHGKGESNATGIKCRNCGDVFSEKWSLMNHRKNKHSNTVAQCRNFLDGNCTYQEDVCWWNHIKNQYEGIKCFIWSEIFDTKTNLMRHRKNNHIMSVRMCNQFRTNSCRFQEAACWFRHILEHENNADEIDPKDKNKDDSESVFQKVLEDLDPPIMIKRKIKEEKNSNQENFQRKSSKSFTKSLRLVGVNSAGLKSKLLTFRKVLAKLNPSVFFIEETK